MRGWQRSARNVRCRNSRTDLPLLSNHSSTPVLEPCSVGNFNPTSGFNANLNSGANVGFSTSIPHHSNDSVETYLTKVNFEEFKDGFVTLLSSQAGLASSDEDIGSLESVVSRAVPSKDVSGSTWSSRQSQPEPCGAAGGAPGLLEQPMRPSARSQLCRSVSLESVESLKSDEEAESAKEPQNEFSEVQGRSSGGGHDSPL
ncbi:ninein-like protein isoform X2 [Muntiacus reevesi]|uniref:ninein-like protein isoform X2 n=1 Tax=Muntiacus reevesi TaxID=9886 RepID=UPI0033070055